MKTAIGKFSFQARTMLSTLLFVLCVNVHAQTSFAPTNIYNAWSTSTETFGTVPTTAGNVVTFSQPARGSGLNNPGAVTSGITSSGWDGPTSEATASAANNFFFLTVTAVSQPFTVTGFSLAMQRSGTGPTNFQVMYSVNAGPFTAFGSPFSTSVNGAFLQLVNGTMPTVPVGQNAVFRVVGWGSSNPAGTCRINVNTSISGTYGAPVVSSISTTTVTGSPFCVTSTTGSPTTVSYTATGSFTGGNTFSSQLSDASGSFASPVTIGTVSSTSLNGSIPSVIPAGTALGTGYRIRVISSTPSVTGTDNGSNLTVQQGVALSGTVSNVSCNGGTNGSVTTATSEGISPFTYAWSNSATTQDITNLAAGTYSVTVTSTNGCTAAISSATVTEPTAIAANATPTDISCNGGSDGVANLTVSGGISPYTYAWSNSATTEDISGLSSGPYSVTVTDNNGCTQTASVSITEPSAISASATATDVLCNGGTDGAANLSVNGGTSPYTYAWSNSATSQNISAVAAGSYSVTITDNNGCTQTASVTVTEPTAISATATATDVLCNGGTSGAANLSVSGGTGIYTFAWSNSATTQNISGIAAGSYSVAITDNNGCVQSASVTVTEPAAISATATATDALCNGGPTGAATLSVNGGTSPYTYAWSNSATTQNLSAVAAGSYSVTITDNNGCTQTASVSITEPSGISASATATDVLCNGATNGAANLSVNGGTSPYTYAWSNSATTQNISGVGAGSYSVTITDNNGCTQTASVSVTQPNAITASATATDVLCNGGTNGAANLSVNGGTGPYTYAWSNSATTQNISGVVAGPYSVIITDNNGCTQTASVTVTEPAAITSTVSQSDVSCNGGNNGSATVSAVGGTPGYTYAWMPSGGTNATESNLGAGTYTVTVTDANGCTHVTGAVIAEPTAISSAIDSSDASCGTCADGSADLTVTGGTGPYSYLWSNGMTTEDLTSVLPGTYTVTITDNNGCTYVDSVTVNFSTSVADITEESISVYPNPSTGENIRFVLPGEQGAVIFVVYDIAGNEVYREQMMGNNGAFNVNPELENGVYTFSVMRGDALYTGRMVIVK